MEEWDRVGWIALATLQPNSKKNLTLQDTNPVRMQNKETDKLNFRQYLNDMKSKLPKKGQYTEEELEARYQEALRRANEQC
jgi:hypothetical protein